MAGGNQYLIKIGAIADDQSFEKEVSSAISRIENTSKSKLKIDLDMSGASVADINKAISQLQTAANANGVQLDFRQQEVALMSLLQTHEKYNAIRKTGTDTEINNVKTLLAQEQKAYQEKYDMTMNYSKTKEAVSNISIVAAERELEEQRKVNLAKEEQIKIEEQIAEKAALAQSIKDEKAAAKAAAQAEKDAAAATAQAEKDAAAATAQAEKDARTEAIQRAKEEKAAITDLNKALADYNKTSLELARAQAKNDQDLFKNEAAETYINTLKKLQTEQLQTKEEAQKLAAEFIGLDAAQEKAGASAQKLDLQIQALDAQMGRTQGTLKTLSSKFTDGLGIGIAMRAVNGLEDAIYSGFREIITTTRELETAMTDIQIVTGDTREETEALMLTYSALAQELGATTAQVSAAANDFLRMGMNTAETNQMIEASTMLSKLGMLESAESTTYLISATQGYQVAAEDAIKVVDRLTAVDMDAAVSAGYLAEAMSRTANSARLAGVDMNELLGLIATTGHVTQQSASRVGEAWKTAFARFRNVKLEKFVDAENPEEVEGINDMERALNHVEIAMRDSEGNWRDYFDILNELIGENGENWDTLDERFGAGSKNAISNAFFGTRQAEFGLSAFENFGQVLDLTETSMNSLGTATEKYAIYQEQLDAKLNTMIAKFEEMVLVSGSEGLLGNLIAIGTISLDFINAIGGMETALTALTASMLVYNSKAIVGFIAGIADSIRSLMLQIHTLYTAGASLTNYVTILGVSKAAMFGLAAAAAAVVVGIGYAITQYNNWRKETIEAGIAASNSMTEIQSLQQQINKAADAGDDLLPVLDLMAEKLGLNADEAYEAAGGVEAYKKSLEDLASEELSRLSGENLIAQDLVKESVEQKSISATDLGFNSFRFQEETQNLSEETGLPSNSFENLEKYLEETKEKVLEIQTIVGETGDISLYEDSDYKYYSAIVDIFEEDLNNLEDLANKYEEIQEQISESGDIETPEVEESTEEILDAVSAYEAAADAISSIGSNISILAGAQEELQYTGMIAASTLQSLMDNNLIQYFSVVNGQLQMSEDAFLDAAEAARINAVETLKTAMMADLAALAEGNMAEMSTFAANALQNAGWSAEVSGQRAANSIGNLTATADAWQYLHNSAKGQMNDLSGNVKLQGQAIVDAYADVAAMVGQINISPTFNAGSGSSQADAARQAAEEAAQAQQEAYNKLLEMTIAMIKQQKEDEKDLLEQQLEGYEKIIDAKKELLEIEQEQRDYQKDVEERSRDIAELETEIEELKYDTSAEGTARRLELEEELAEKKGELEDVQYEESIQRQEDALDQEYERYKEQIDMQIEEIDRFLQQTGTITAMAMDMIEQRSDHLYQSLIDWNRMYGDSLDQTVIDAWNGAAAAAANYNAVVASGATSSGGGGSYGSGSSGSGSSGSSSSSKGETWRDEGKSWDSEDTGWVDGWDSWGKYFANGTNNYSGRATINELGKEAVVTPYGTVVDLPSKGNNGSGVVTSRLTQNLSTLGELAPNLLGKLHMSGKVENKDSVNVGTLMSINVEGGGTLDKNILPDIEKIAEKTIEKINNITQRVGTPKNAKFGMI